ncbi:hypothetical protein DL96DRAFT_1579572 [Flagelloscypha sp. PMI_526]|nr:hypothetical protein DL96DRAFT_1579572 [Flagelloscypha sp. PMI_526]
MSSDNSDQPLPPTSPADIQTISDFGTQITGDFLTLVVAFLIYGAYICLFAMSTRILLRRWKTSSSSLLLMVLSMILFISQSLRIPTILYITAMDVKVLLGASDDPILVDRWEALRVISHVTPIMHWSRAITTIVADAIVVWRACMMPNRETGFALALTGLMILNAGNILVYPFMFTFARAWMRQHDRIVQVQYSSGLVSSLVTNFFATAFIGWRAWRHHKNIKSVLGNARNPQVGKVLVTLVETGVIYLVLQFTNTLVNLVPPEAMLVPGGAMIYAQAVFDEIVLGFAAISPVVVILVVQGEKSVFRDPSTPSSSRMPQIANLSAFSGFGSPAKRDSFGMTMTTSSGSIHRDIEKF